MLLITADRGLAGAYSTNAIKEGEALIELLQGERNMRSCPSWSGAKGSGSTSSVSARSPIPGPASPTRRPTRTPSAIAEALLDRFLMKTEDGGADEIHIVYTRFHNRARQEVQVLRILPLEVVEEVVDTSASTITGGDNAGGTPVWPLYDFEPVPQRCSTHCCRSTWSIWSTPHCCSPQHPSTPLGSAP